MLDVVRDHVAVQAQVIGSAELAIHARVDGMATRRRPQRPVARPDARQDLGDARDAAPGRRRRAAGARRRPRHADQLDAAPLAPLLRGHRGGDARPPGRHRRRPHRQADDPRRARRGAGDAARQPRLRASASRRAGARSSSRPRAAASCASGPTTAATSRSSTRGSGSAARCRNPARTAIGAVIERHLTAFPGLLEGRARALVGRPGRGAAAQADREPRRPRRRGHWPTARRCSSGARTSPTSPTSTHRRTSACCPPSTRTRSRSRRRPSRCCRWRGARWSRARRAGSARS